MLLLTQHDYYTQQKPHLHIALRFHLLQSACHDTTLSINYVTERMRFYGC
jgi:hypothetical protein